MKPWNWVEAMTTGYLVSEAEMYEDEAISLFWPFLEPNDDCDPERITLLTSHLECPATWIVA